MPIYEYECSNCGHRLEALQKFSDEPLKDCPECSESELRRLISAAAFHLKGTGWYATDFRDKGKPAKEAKQEKEEKESKPAEKKADGKSESSESKSADKPAKAAGASTS